MRREIFRILLLTQVVISIFKSCSLESLIQKFKKLEVWLTACAVVVLYSMCYTLMVRLHCGVTTTRLMCIKSDRTHTCHAKCMSTLMLRCKTDEKPQSEHVSTSENHRELWFQLASSAVTRFEERGLNYPVKKQTPLSWVWIFNSI